MFYLFLCGLQLAPLSPKHLCDLWKGQIWMLHANLLPTLIQETDITCHWSLGPIGKDLLSLLAFRPAPLLHWLGIKSEVSMTSTKTHCMSDLVCIFSVIREGS